MLFSHVQWPSLAATYCSFPHFPSAEWALSQLERSQDPKTASSAGKADSTAAAIATR